MTYNQADQNYHDLVEDIYDNGTLHENRTGVDTRRIWGHMARFDLMHGFPLLTTKKMAIKAAFTELLGFVRGITDVRWYQERGCKIWNADHERWHGPDLERDKAYLAETTDPTEQGLDIADEAALCREYLRLEESVKYRVENPYGLGRIYGAQWRDLNGYDQLAEIIKALASGSNSRRLIMSAWNPAEGHLMCLPPCHITYHFVRDGDRLNLAMWQRSCDVALGVPFNWATTALLCHLVAHATELIPGKVTWFGDDVHIYEPHLETLYEQIHRSSFEAPVLGIEAPRGTMPWEIEFDDLKIDGYTSHSKVPFELFVG